MESPGPPIDSSVELTSPSTEYEFDLTHTPQKTDSFEFGWYPRTSRIEFNPPLFIPDMKGGPQIQVHLYQCQRCHSYYYLPVKTRDRGCKACNAREDHEMVMYFMRDVYNKSQLKQQAKSERKQVGKISMKYTTWTSAHDISKEELFERISRVLGNKTYPVIAHYGCYEKTQQGRWHAHVLFVFRLKKRKDRNEYIYPTLKKDWVRWNDGENIKVQTVSDAENVENVINYINKEDGEKIGDIEIVRHAIQEKVRSPSETSG